MTCLLCFRYRLIRRRTQGCPLQLKYVRMWTCHSGRVTSGHSTVAMTVQLLSTFETAGHPVEEDQQLVGIGQTPTVLGLGPGFQPACREEERLRRFPLAPAQPRTRCECDHK